MTIAERLRALLQEMFEADPLATSQLLSHSVPCNRRLAEHERVQVRASREAGTENFNVTPLGLLTGLCLTEGDDVCVAVYDDGDASEKLLRFEVRKKWW